MPYADPEAAKSYSRAYNRAWRAANPERHRAHNAAWRATHREDIRVYGAAYKAAHSEERRAQEVAYDAAQKVADPDGYASRLAWDHANHDYGRGPTLAEFRELWYGSCVACGATPARGVDHIVGGRHGGGPEIDNLQPMCLSDNHRKAGRQSRTTSPNTATAGHLLVQRSRRAAPSPLAQRTIRVAGL